MKPRRIAPELLLLILEQITSPVHYGTHTCGFSALHLRNIQNPQVKCGNRRRQLARAAALAIKTAEQVRESPKNRIWSAVSRCGKTAHLGSIVVVQAKLCLLDAKTRALIVPILYKSCEIRRLEGVSSFCKAIKENRTLGRQVMGLIIYCPPPKPRWCEADVLGLMDAWGLSSSSDSSARSGPHWTENQISDLRGALGLLPNLDLLSIACGKDLTSVFNGLNVAFQLKTLDIVHFPGTAFMQFLKGQKANKDLRLRSLDYDMGEIYDFDSDPEWGWDGGSRTRILDPVVKAAADAAFLPNLCFLTSEPLKCTALAPGRPITRVVILQNVYAPPLRNDRYTRLAIALGKTSVSLKSLEFISRLQESGRVDGAFMRLIYPKERSLESQTRACAVTAYMQRLRALVLHDTEGNIVSHATQYPFLQRKAKLLGNTCKMLERPEVPIRNDGVGSYQEVPFPGFFRQFFGKMGKLSAWQEVCPTLTKVMLYDEEIA
ncbi:hypothetical protein BDV93DRAFT_512350 [Ceratobasidium sp. AG-I]|nr:hypothetical protein BDV93DRAFT_512350 [Ceratobasidium sp. AG-I]